MTEEQIAHKAALRAGDKVIRQILLDLDVLPRHHATDDGWTWLNKADVMALIRLVRGRLWKEYAEAYSSLTAEECAQDAVTVGDYVSKGG